MTTADEFEIVWTTVTALGFVASLFAVGDALGDVRLVRRQRVNGARRIVARANFRREVLRSTSLLGWTLAGVAVLSVPSPTAGGIRAFVISTLILGALLTTVGTLLDRLTRYRVLNYEDAPAHLDGPAGTHREVHHVEDAEDPTPKEQP